MKDTISYDLVHQQQQQHQQQHQQHHHQQNNPDSWNQQRHPQQNHSPNVYANHHSAQSRALGLNQQPPQPQQQQLHHQAHIGQYSHQQLQAVTHHNNDPASSAYYQPAHLYPSFQEQQQQAGGEHQQHHHPAGAAVTSSSNTSSALSAAVAAATQQQHHQHQHQQQHSNTQVSALHHAGWSSGVGGLATQAHHAVVTDHSSLAYMPHAYQSHNTSINEHNSNTTGPLANQPIGTGHQASSYAVDSLYNSAVAAAAVAAYGYNNYNAAFFQTSNNGPPTQAAHPSQANLSAFWNHHQGSQHRTGHTQSVEQTSIQQRQQQLATDQSTNYIHDPRLYYMRPSYEQVIQNFGQNQTQIQSNQQQASDLTHNRMSVLTQQQSLLGLQGHESQRFDASHQLQQQHSSITGQSAVITATAAAMSGSQASLHTKSESTHPSNQHASITSNQQGIKMQASRISPQYPVQKQSSVETGAPSLIKSPKDNEPQAPSNSNKNLPSSVVVKPPATNIQKVPAKDVENTSTLNKQPSALNESDQSVVSQSNAHKTQAVIKNETVGQYQARATKSNNSGNISQSRNAFRAANDERQKLDMIERSRDPRETRPLPSEARNQAPAASKQSDQSDMVQSVEDSLASLTLSSRKTTWASIASQPAKVAQPKSLKSKISGSNSVLSSAKHLATSVTLDSSSLDSKNGINPAIKSSVSTAASSLQRGSIPPPISKANVAPTNLGLDLLGDDGLGSSKISWPAVNASINLSLDDPPLKKEPNNLEPNRRLNDRFSRNDEPLKQDVRESVHRDHNHNQGPNSRNSNDHRNPTGHRDENRDDSRENHWANRRGPRDQKTRRDSDRKEPKLEDQLRGEDQRGQVNSRREYRPAGRGNNFRGDESPFRDNKRAPMMDRQDQRGANNNYRSPAGGRHDPPRDQQQSQNRNNDSAPHHHYSNLRFGNSVRDSQGKLDLKEHPHLNPANYNPKSFDCEPENARFFIIKSYSEDDIHRSIKYSIWCSTKLGNQRLDEAYRQQQAKNGELFLFFSVNGSGHFCGMAQMTSTVDFDSSSGVWAQSKWLGEFSVKWIYVKDVPNTALRHIKLANNEGKPVTNSRDTQEVPNEQGKSVLSIIHKYPHETSLFDDFLHYEKRQEEEKLKKSQTEQMHHSGRADERANGGGFRYNRSYNQRAYDFRDGGGNRDRSSRFES